MSLETDMENIQTDFDGWHLDKHCLSCKRINNMSRPFCYHCASDALEERKTRRVINPPIPSGCCKRTLFGSNHNVHQRFDYIDPKTGEIIFGEVSGYYADY